MASLTGVVRVVILITFLSPLLVLKGEPTDAIQIKDIKISPDPPKPGHNLTIYASGTVNQLIDVSRLDADPTCVRA